MTLDHDIAALAREYFRALDLAESRRRRPGCYRADDADAVHEAEHALRAAAGAPPIPGVGQ